MGKWFPRLYDKLMGPLERRGFRDIRKYLIKMAQGKVLEIGSGTGLNFPYYEQATHLIAIDPEPIMIKQSLERTKHSPFSIEVMLAAVEDLPFPENSFDMVVGTLVLCTIQYPEKALQEIRRVCKPGGQILLIEHIRHHQPVLGKIQDWLTPIWKRLCDGCHLNRETLELVKKSGLKVMNIERHYKGIFLVIETVNNK